MTTASLCCGDLQGNGIKSLVVTGAVTLKQCLDLDGTGHVPNVGFPWRAARQETKNSSPTLRIGGLMVGWNWRCVRRGACIFIECNERPSVGDKDIIRSCAEKLREFLRRDGEVGRSVVTISVDGNTGQAWRPARL